MLVDREAARSVLTSSPDGRVPEEHGMIASITDFTEVYDFSDCAISSTMCNDRGWTSFGRT